MMTVTSSTSSVGVAVMTSLSVAAEHDETENVNTESGDSDVEQEVDVRDLFRCDESRDPIGQDGEAEGDEEDRVNEGSQHLGPHPPIGIFLRIPITDLQ